MKSADEALAKELHEQDQAKARAESEARKADLLKQQRQMKAEQNAAYQRQADEVAESERQRDEVSKKIAAERAAMKHSQEQWRLRAAAP